MNYRPSKPINRYLLTFVNGIIRRKNYNSPCVTKVEILQQSIIFFMLRERKTCNFFIKLYSVRTLTWWLNLEYIFLYGIFFLLWHEYQISNNNFSEVYYYDLFDLKINNWFFLIHNIIKFTDYEINTIYVKAQKNLSFIWYVFVHFYRGKNLTCFRRVRLISIR